MTALLRNACVVAVLVGVSACNGSAGESDAGALDSGSPVDSGTVTDSGVMTDDAGADAGTDAGLPDAGPGGVDAGGTVYLADPVTSGRELRVCPSGCTYTLLSAAVAAIADGDTILIEPGTYDDCATINANNIVIRGLKSASGARPSFGPKVCGRKGILVIGGHDVRIESLELHGAIDTTNTDNNWAGVRLDSNGQIANIQLRDLFIHDCDNGVLGPNISAHPNVLLVESSVFSQLGRAGYAHGLYIGEAPDLFVIRNSTVSSNHDDGHLIKSRAHHSIVECSTVASLNGENSYAMDFPNGGTVEVRNSVVEQGPNINNGSNLFVSFALESGSAAPHRLLLQNNVLVNDYTGVGRARVGGSGSSVDATGWAGNQYVGTGMFTVEGVTGATGGFTNVSSRTAAGLQAFDGTLATLPSAPHCP